MPILDLPEDLLELFKEFVRLKAEEAKEAAQQHISLQKKCEGFLREIDFKTLGLPLAEVETVKIPHKVELNSKVIPVHENEPHDYPKEFDPNATAIRKAIFALSQKKKILTCRQIVDYLEKFMPELRTPEGNRKFTTALSVSLKTNGETGKRIRRVNIGDPEYYYALPEWYDERYNLNDEYKV
ncbi:MAG: hypothetical protein R2794_11770 [Chitinophagales bacterium]